MQKSDIENIINNLPKNLTGNWIKLNSSYENELCIEINWKKDTNRYFDAIFDSHKIEIKKGKSIWLDLVRYSEIVLGQGERETITAFFIPTKGKEKINDIYFVDTKAIIDKLNITDSIAKTLLNLKSVVPRSLNAQASLTIKDVVNIAFYHHQFE